VWSAIRSHCEDLFCSEDLARYQELCDGEVFDKIGDDDRRTEWVDLVDKCNSDDEYINVSDFERQLSRQDESEDKSKDMRNKLIAYDQIRLYSLYVEHKPAKLAAYCKFLVCICFLCMHCNIVVTIVSHHYSVGVVQW
jgi:hypothetical protein